MALGVTINNSSILYTRCLTFDIHIGHTYTGIFLSLPRTNNSMDMGKSTLHCFCKSLPILYDNEYTSLIELKMLSSMRNVTLYAGSISAATDACLRV